MIETLTILGLLGIAVYAISVASMSDDTGASTDGGTSLDFPTPVFDLPGFEPDMPTDSEVKSRAAVIIKGFEGFSAVPYNDPPGSNKMSIGYGHQIKPSENLKNISEQEAYDLLIRDIDSAWSCVKSSVNVDLTLNQAAALTSLSFNIGCGAFKSSTLLRYLNLGNYSEAAKQFGKWVYAGGQISSALIARRDEEETVFNEV